jgi:hypothetical protein
MDAPALGEREQLVPLTLRAEKGSNLIKGVTDTCGGREGFEPVRGPVPLFNAPMVLFHKIIEIRALVDHDRGAVLGIIAPNGGGMGKCNIATYVDPPETSRCNGAAHE